MPSDAAICHQHRAPQELIDARLEVQSLREALRIHDEERAELILRNGELRAANDVLRELVMRIGRAWLTANETIGPVALTALRDLQEEAQTDADLGQ